MIKQLVLEAKYPMKRVFSFLQKHKKKKINCNLDISIELTENHFYNKNVRKIPGQETVAKNMNMNTFDTNVKIRARKKKLSKKTKRNSNSYISNICLKSRKSNYNIYTSLTRKRSQNDEIPKCIKALPVVPFWRSSFDMMTKVNHNNNTLGEFDTSYRRRGSWLYCKNSVTSLGNNYVTMKKKKIENEPVYV